jgi:hypothetical protein
MDEERVLLLLVYLMSTVVFWALLSCGLVGGLKIEAVCSSETLVPTYKSTQRHNPEDHCGYLHHHENLKS